MNEYLKIMEELAEFSELTSDIKSNITPIGVTGVSDSVRAHLIFCVCEALDKGGLVIARSETEAAELYKDLSFFAGNDRVIRMCAGELMFYDAEAKSRDVTGLRISALSRLVADPKNKIVLTSPEAMLSATVPYDMWRDSAISLETGDEIEPDELTGRLISLGYCCEDMVEGAGQFSIRGGIVDVFPFTAENPLRMEFFDTEVDSIRTFDVETQRTIDRAERFEAGPASELSVKGEAADKLISKLNEVEKSLDCSNERDSRAAEILRRDMERLKEGINISRIYMKKFRLCLIIFQKILSFLRTNLHGLTKD